MSVNNRLQDRLKDMRPSEAEVTRRLLRNLGLVAEKNLREIAAGCQTSDATVMRACRAAGFDGFQDLKYHVLRELTAGEVREAPASHESYHADISASLGAAETDLRRAAQLIRGAQRVALAGVGASYGVVLIATDILFTMGKQALPVQNEQMAGFAFTQPVTGLVVLAISHSGETQFPVQVVKEAQQARVKTIGLTNEPASGFDGPWTCCCRPRRWNCRAAATPLRRASASWLCWICSSAGWARWPAKGETL